MINISEPIYIGSIYHLNDDPKKYFKELDHSDICAPKVFLVPSFTVRRLGQQDKDHYLFQVFWMFFHTRENLPPEAIFNGDNPLNNMIMTTTEINQLIADDKIQLFIPDSRFGIDSYLRTCQLTKNIDDYSYLEKISLFLNNAFFKPYYQSRKYFLNSRIRMMYHNIQSYIQADMIKMGISEI